MDDDEKLIQYLIKQGKKFGLSAVEYAKAHYKNTDFFKWLKDKEYFKNYYRENKDKYTVEKGKFVYLLLDDNKVVYVGSTQNIKNRLSQHHHINRKFQKVIYYDLTDTDLEMSEVRQIEYTLQDLYKNSLVDCTVYPACGTAKLDVLEEVKPQVIDGYRIKDELLKSVNYHPKRIKDVLLGLRKDDRNENKSND